MQYKKKSMYIFIMFILVLVVAGAMLLNNKNKNVAAEAKVINISRHPEVSDFSVYFKDVTKLPDIKDENFDFDIRSADISSDDVINRLEDLLYTTYDSKTKWPNKLPDGFNPKEVMELYKNPGLNIRELHKQNVTGKGVGIAIIDQTLLVDHVEYKDRIKLYEESENSKASDAAMHGSAVASIAVGKTVGVAPESDLYYIAGDLGTYDANNNFKYDFKLLAHDIDRILEINKSLPKENKIRVISASIGWDSSQDGYAEVNAAVDRAKAEGILVVSSSLDDTYGFYFHGLNQKEIAILELSQPLYKIDCHIWHDVVEENPITNLLADALVDVVSCDMSIINSGVIIGGVRKGDVSYKKLLEISPSPLNPTYMEIKGKYIREALQLSLKSEICLQDGKGSGFRGKYLGRLHISNAIIEHNGNEILSVKINNCEMEDEKTYKVATSDYLRRGTGYPSLANGKNERYNPEYMRAVLKEYLNKKDFLEKCFIDRWRKI